MLALLATYILTCLYWLVWCENRYHDNLPVYKAGASTKRESLYKAGEPLQSGRA